MSSNQRIDAEKKKPRLASDLEQSAENLESVLLQTYF